jgi:hypothetical protein
MILAKFSVCGRRGCRGGFPCDPSSGEMCGWLGAKVMVLNGHDRMKRTHRYDHDRMIRIHHHGHEDMIMGTRLC